MRADLRHLVELVAPPRIDVIGVEMRGIADRGMRRAAEHLLCPVARGTPGGIRIAPRERAVASEAELATGGPLRAFEHHAADRPGKGRMAHAVEDDLHHRALVAIAAARLGHSRERKAVTRAQPVCCAPVETEGAGRARTDCGEFDRGIACPRIGRGKFGQHHRIFGRSGEIGHWLGRFDGRDRGRGRGGAGQRARERQQCDRQQHQRRECRQRAAVVMRGQGGGCAIHSGYLGAFCACASGNAPTAASSGSVRPPWPVPCPSGPRFRPAPRRGRPSFRPCVRGRG